MALQPTWLKTLASRFTALFNKNRLEDELDEELHGHLEFMVEENIRQGMTPAEARRTARLSFGGVEQTKEVYRGQRGLPVVETLLRDLRYAFRLLMKNPFFTAAAVLTMALGIGANSAVFSVINAVVLRPLPYRQPDRLVTIWQPSRYQTKRLPISPGLFLDWRERNQAFESIAAYEDSYSSNRAKYFLTGGSEPEHVWAANVTVGLFDVLGVRAALGRTFLPEEEQPGHPVVILSDGLWRRRFGADPNLIGHTISLDDKNYIVVGVMPPDVKLSYPKGAELWVPITFNSKVMKRRDIILFWVIARLKPGITLTQAQAAMNSLSLALKQEHPTDSGLPVGFLSLHESVAGDTRGGFVLLLAIVGFVLLIACINVSNLLLVRALERSKELAVRVALGASRRRLIQQLLTESVLLSALGGAAGFLLVFWANRLFVSLIPATVPRGDEVRVDGWVLGFTLLLSLLTGLLFGLAPALSVSRPELNEMLKDTGQTSTASKRTHRLRSLLVVAEVALSLVLLIGAGLMLKSMWRLHQSSLGFKTDNLLTMALTLPSGKYASDSKQTAFLEETLNRIGHLPAVRTVSATSTIPLRGQDQTGPFNINAPLNLSVDHYASAFRQVSPDYFQTMGIPIIHGREFSVHDRAGAPRVAIINEAFGHQYFRDQNPIGQRLVGQDEAEIIGIVGDTRQNALRLEPEPAVYEPILQSPAIRITIAVSAVDPVNLVAQLKHEIWAIDKDLPIEKVATMKEIVAEAQSGTRLFTVLLGSFAFIALTLASIGIYSVMAYSVSQRIHEIGIRMALGAQTRDVLKLIVTQAMFLTLVGVIIGVAGAIGLTRQLASLLYGVTPTDPLTFIGVSVLLTMVALLACYLPARRATKIDPLVALRYE